MKRTLSFLLVAILLAAGIGTSGANAASLPKGGIINCSSPGDSQDWANAKRQLADQLRRDGVRFTRVERAVGCLVVTARESDGHSHFLYYDPQSFRRVR